MKIIEPGHVYELRSLDGDGTPETITFVNREPGTEHPGTQTQEVLRALIDRTMHCDNCIRWHSNDKIIFHLRMALALHESRAIERKAEKGYYAAEQVSTSDRDGHFQLIEDNVCMPQRGEDGKSVISDAEIYLRKDKNAKAEGKPAQFCMLGKTED
jgi:hypothetical protein